MEETSQPKTSILEVAWNRFAQYDAASQKRKKSQYTLRKWVYYVSVLATFFAILSSVFPQFLPTWDAKWETAIKITLIILPIVSSILTAFTGKFYRGTDWLVLRAGAEQILKEIYTFRTILQKTDKRRRTWLEGRLRDIQMQVYTGLNGEMVLEAYNEQVPPLHKDGSPRKDPGFKDLTAEEYYDIRLRDQLDWHVKRVNKMQRDRIALQVWILAVGGVGAFLAAMGGNFGLWVALTTSIATALVGWQEIQSLDMTVRNYSKVIIDLTSITNHWKQLDDDEHTKKEFYGIVKDTETVLWNQNLEYIKSMQEAFESSKMEEEDVVNQILKTGEDNNPQSPGPVAPVTTSESGSG